MRIPIPKEVEVKIVREKEIYMRGKWGIQKAIVEGVKESGRDLYVEGEEGREVVRRMVQGVSEGYKGRLKIQGVGYRAKEEGEQLKLTIGYRDEKEVKKHPRVKIEITGNGTVITGRSGIKEELRGWMGKVEQIRPARKDRYKGKGIR